MCRVLGVSTSGYYAWKDRAPKAAPPWTPILVIGSETVSAESCPDRNRLFECSIDPAGFVLYDNDGNEMDGLGVVDIERRQGATLAVNPRLPEL